MSDVKLNERQAKLISVISALSKEPIRSTVLQKIIFLCLEQVKSCDLEYSYKIGHFGPFSKDLMDDLEDLEKKGMIKLKKGMRVIVTSPIKGKWPTAEKAALEFKSRFPDESAIMISALTSPNVYGRSVGELVKISR